MGNSIHGNRMGRPLEEAYNVIEDGGGFRIRLNKEMMEAAGYKAGDKFSGSVNARGQIVLTLLVK